MSEETTAQKLRGVTTRMKWCYAMEGNAGRRVVMMEWITALQSAIKELEREGSSGIESVNRDRFEAWYRQQGAACIEEDEITESLSFDDELEEYDDPECNLLWRAWCAAIDG